MENIKQTKARPKRDGSGQGRRANLGRSGCNPTKPSGKGRSLAR